MRISRVLRTLRSLEPLGHLVDANSKRVPIVRAGQSASKGTGETDAEETYSNRNRLAMETMENRSPNLAMAKIPLMYTKTINNMTRNRKPQDLRQRVAQMYNRLQTGKGHMPALESIDVDSQITGLFLQNYTGIQNALREVRQRVPDFEPQTVLDVGFGPATGLLAAREVMLNDNQTFEHETAVIIGHPRMKRRAKELLGDTSVQFRWEVPAPSSMKRYDLVIAQHQLFQPGRFSEDLVNSHVQQLAQLVNRNGIIVLVEKGDPLGFEAVALGRENLLRPKFGFHVVGPCVHKKKCPLQMGLEMRANTKNPGKENWCRASQLVERPRFAMELKKGQYLAQKWTPELARGAGGKTLKGHGRPGGNNHEIAHFSWVALQTGNSEHSTTNTSDTTTSDETKARIMKQPMKRHGHVIMEVCTAQGKIEHWTVPRSQGKQAYHDARKANEQDVWALDAKVKQSRGGVRENSKLTLVKSVAELVQKDPCNDWWLPKTNPHFKFANHQQRIHSENNVNPEPSGFIEVMESLIADEGRHDKLMSKQIHKRYRKKN